MIAAAKAIGYGRARFDRCQQFAFNVKERRLGYFLGNAEQ
jgi:hypothetical protein